MFLEINHSLDNFGNTCLVVSTQQGMTIGHNEVLTDMLAKFGENFRTCNKTSLFQLNISTVVVLNNMRFDISSRGVGTGVHVGNETYHGGVLLSIGWECGIEIAFVCQFYVFQTNLLELVAQEARKDKLFVRTRRLTRVFGRLCVECRIFKKSLNNIHILTFIYMLFAKIEIISYFCLQTS